MERIEGRNPVREALLAGRSASRVLVAAGARVHGTLEEIVRLARDAGVRVEFVPRAVLDRAAGTSAHQGVIAEVQEYRYRSWREAVSLAASRGEVPLLLALDGIQDPQNLGSLARSAEVLGAHGLMIPGRRAAPVTASAAKAAAGALERLVVDRVTNLGRTLGECKQEGLWVVALDGKASSDLPSCALLVDPLVLVVGAEGSGVSRLIRERADALVRIPQRGSIESLGAAAAGAIALYEARRARDANLAGGR